MFPGQPKIKLSGGIERVHAELVRQNPDWNTHYSNHTKRSSLEKRAFDVQGYFCGGRWDYCHPATIEEGIDYLRRVRGLPSLGPGPGNCARVSCSYLSAIWWCNDVSNQLSYSIFFPPGIYFNRFSQANEGKTLQGGFNDIADGASFILHNCLLNPGQFAVVSGQAFTTSNWNVIVRFDSDHC